MRKAAPPETNRGASLSDRHEVPVPTTSINRGMGPSPIIGNQTASHEPVSTAEHTAPVTQPVETIEPQTPTPHHMDINLAGSDDGVRRRKRTSLLLFMAARNEKPRDIL